MTGATDVHLLLWSEDRHDWLLPAPGGGTAPVSGTGHETAVPMSVLRYAQRTGEPLVTGDATHDDRFARDPYFTGVGCCALLALPILNRGALRAVLLLENRLIRGAFTTERLNAVKLIAGQLAVSLDNAQLYAELSTSRARIVATADQTRRRIERDLHDGAQQRLVSLALQLRAVQAAAPPEAAGLARQVGDVAAGLAARWRNCARSPMACTRPSSPTAGCARRSKRWPAAAPSRSAWMSGGGRLPEPTEIAAYYAVSEALTNTIKHAHASAADVEVTAPNGVLQVMVRDDGRGGAAFAPAPACIGLKDRIEAAGGRITLHSPPGAGTTVQITLPLTDPSRPGTPAAAADPPMTPAAAPPPLPGRPPRLGEADGQTAPRPSRPRGSASRNSEQIAAGPRMIDIAAEAGVAVQTVYFTFHTKAELLQACYELAVLGEDDPRPPPDQPWYAAMLAARDGRTAIRQFAEGNSAIVARVALLDEVVRSAAHEPDAVQVRARNEQLRRDGYARIVAHLAGRFGLRPGLDPAHAVDILLTLAGPATYRALAVDYGWPHDGFVDWLATTLGQQLLAPGEARASPPLGSPASTPAR